MANDLARIVDAVREEPPKTPAHLQSWALAFTGVQIASRKVCRAHNPPLEWFSRIFFDNPDQALILGARGSGKSFLSGLHTHCQSRWNPRLGTRILGGSVAQSRQIYEAIAKSVLDGQGNAGTDKDSIQCLLKESASYGNGSHVSILAASARSVRGPHVPRLKFDEVDEIPTDLRESAMGMCMRDRWGNRASVVMTSTWHNLGGPMTELVERGQAGEIPFYTTCALDILERCPDERSGIDLENCPTCPLVRWCHAERDINGGFPLAKLANGHYSIDALIQKVNAVSRRVFESDYLCQGPRPDGLWFPGFTSATHVSPIAEYDPNLPVVLAVDSGVFTGAVWFQVARWGSGVTEVEEVRVFADYLSENLSAEQNARNILEISRQRCVGRLDTIATDPAGGSRNPVGPTVFHEYERTGLRPLRRWPSGSVADGLALVDSFVTPANGVPRLKIHPRCNRTAIALTNYRRAKRGGQWQDYPEDPQHPHEDLVDALRGGMRTVWPGGRVPKTTMQSRPVSTVFH